MKHKIKSWLKIIAVRLSAFLPKIVRDYFLFEVPTGIQTTQVYCNTKGLSFSIIRSGEKTEQNIPETPEEEINWKFYQDSQLHHAHPDVWVAEIPRAYVVTQEAYILTPERLLLTDVSVDWIKSFEDHKLFNNRIILPNYKYLGGTSTIISGPRPCAYYHWLIDVLPRVGILHQAGVNFSEIDRFLIPPNNLPVIPETLQILGIDSSRCQELIYRSCFQTETLILPSMHGISNKPSRWVLDFLRNSFLKAADEVPDVYPHRFFVSRKENRRVLNESELLPILKSYDIHLVQPEKLSFKEQVALFARAEVVVALHGAGLANLIFSPSTTSVVELFSPSYVNLSYWWIANLLGIRYSYLEGDRPPQGYSQNLMKHDMIISPVRLKSWLDAWL